MKVVALGEIMMRLSTSDITTFNNLDTYFGGAEYNTITALSTLGHECNFITILPNNQLSSRISIEAKKYGLDLDVVSYKEGRIGCYYTLLGNDIIPTEVIYDRLGSAFYNLEIEDFNQDKCLENADLFHVSGITPALNDAVKELTYKFIKQAKSKGILISYDSNYRSKLWSQKKAGDFLENILPLVDYVFLGSLDIKYLLKMEISSLEEGYKILKEKYPNLKIIASTNREVISSTLHKIQVNIFDDKLYQTDIHDIKVVDRIGGGDAFTAGVLDGVLNKLDVIEIADNAMATLKYKHVKKGDNCFITKDIVDKIKNANGLDVKR